MNFHASATRRQILGLFAGAAAASAGVAGRRSGVLQAVDAVASVESAARAEAPAERVGLRLPELLLPVEPGDGLIVLDNFGGTSVSLGACSHKGIDIFPTTATTRTLVACVDGVIEGQRFAGSSGAQGNAWILQDDNGVSYRYHHIDEFGEGLEVGSIVRRGDPIATMGKTGNAGSEHLHFEVRRDGSSGTAVDPIPLFTFPIAGVELRTFGGDSGCD